MRRSVTAPSGRVPSLPCLVSTAGWMESREGEYARTLQSGVALLREQGVRDETLMTLDFANPFPALGDPWCMHVGRHISLEMALPGERLFADAAYIMIPTYWRERETGDFLLEVYGGYLAEAYVAVAGNGDWRLLRRGLGVLEAGLG